MAALLALIFVKWHELETDTGAAGLISILGVRVARRQFSIPPVRRTFDVEREVFRRHARADSSRIRRFGMTRFQGLGIWAIRPLAPTRNADAWEVPLMLMALKVAVGWSFMSQRLGVARRRSTTKVCATTKTPG